MKLPTNPVIANPLPTITIGGAQITRMIMGGNIISGTSHLTPQLDQEMEDYYTTENIKKALRRCEECGINTVALRTDKHIMRVLREYWNEGGQLQWMAQTASEMISFRGNVNATMNYNPVAFYHHGSITDNLMQEKKYDVLKEHFKILRDTGKPYGMATHNPDYIRYADEHFDVDFYMACVYNLTKIEHVSSAILGRSNEGEHFDDADIPLMYKAIQETKRPCFAFKILGATRRCGSPAEVRGCFQEAFDTIKPTDAVMVGMFQRDKDQIAENCQTVRDILAAK
nr:hypothetical protein [bacterium]